MPWSKAWAPLWRKPWRTRQEEAVPQVPGAPTDPRLEDAPPRHPRPHPRLPLEAARAHPDRQETVPVGVPLLLETVRTGRLPEMVQPDPQRPMPSRTVMVPPAQGPIPPCPISRRRQFPGKDPPSSRSPAAAQKHSAQRPRVPGGPLCRLGQRPHGRILRVLLRPRPRLLLQWAQPRQRAVSPPKHGRKHRSVRPFPG